MVPVTGYLSRRVIGPFWLLIHPQNRLLGDITEHQAPLFPDDVEKLLRTKYNANLI